MLPTMKLIRSLLSVGAVVAVVGCGAATVTAPDPPASPPLSPPPPERLPEPRTCMSLLPAAPALVFVLSPPPPPASLGGRSLLPWYPYPMPGFPALQREELPARHNRDG